MDKKQKPLAQTASALAILFATNWVAGQVLGYPIVFCMVQPLSPWLAELIWFLAAACLLTFTAVMFNSGIVAALPALGLFFLMALLPDWFRILFGPSC